MDENTRYQVLRNDEEQYSLWPVDVEVPAGWQPVGKEGSKQDCMSYVDEVWTDMRPKSLREFMDGKAGEESGQPAQATQTQSTETPAG